MDEKKLWQKISGSITYYLAMLANFVINYI